MKHTHNIIIACALALASTASAERNYIAWGQRQNPNSTTTTERGVAVTTDKRGNVFVTGYNDVSGGNDTWYTAKYDGLTGAKVWEKTYSNFTGDDQPKAIATDSDGNVIVGGFSASSNQRDFYTIKYAAADGAVQWAQRYNNSNQNGGDEITALAVDANDNVVVTGKSVDSGKQDDFYTIKYNSAGSQVWAKRYSTSFIDVPNALAIAPDGDAVVVGRSRVGSDICFYTVRYKASDGTVLWDETYDNAVQSDDDVATSVAVTPGDAQDPTGAVLVTGSSRDTSSASYSYHTIKYPAAGGSPRWSRRYTGPGGNSLDTPFIGTDLQGNALISGTATLDNFRVVYYAAKYAAATGAIVWQNSTDVPAGSPANTSVTDNANAMVVDGAGNVVVTGTSYFAATNTGDDYLTVKFDGATGNILWRQRLNGDADSGNDDARALAVDFGGDVIVTGTAKKASPSANFEIVTVKYSHFLLADGDPVNGTGLTAAAVVSGMNVPATADDGGIVAHITVKDGKKTLSAILPQDGSGGNTVAALQGQPAPGIANAEFKSFGEPVSAPNGTYAFSAKISGVSGSEAEGVWTNTLNGTLGNVLQKGKQVPGLNAGELLNSVLSISLQSGQLVALITVKGTGVTGANNTVLYSRTMAGGTALLRTGQAFTADGTASTIKKLSVFTPPKTSPGHGRYHGSLRTVANVTLADKRTVLASVTNAGVPTAVATSGADAPAVAMGAKWKSFGPYGAGSSGFNQTALGTLAPKLGGVTPATDTAIVTSLLGNSVNTVIARESSPASNIAGASYVSFSDPVSNNLGTYAFLAKVKGTGVTGANSAVLYHGSNATPAIIARTGGDVPDGAGVTLPQKFTAFKSFALPGGANSAPIFLATVKGTGVSGKNSLGLWGTDSDGFLRQLLRNGDELGEYTVKKFTMLTPAKGALSVSRSFNNAGNVTALVNFTDKSNAIIRVNIP